MIVRINRHAKIIVIVKKTFSVITKTFARCVSSVQNVNLVMMRHVEAVIPIYTRLWNSVFLLMHQNLMVIRQRKEIIYHNNQNQEMIYHNNQNQEMIYHKNQNQEMIYL